MFKLVVIAGKLRGQEFELENGENVIGRDADLELSIPIEGISKRHLSLTVSEDSVYIKDLNSSNGTFIDGKAISSRTIENGDKIAIPDCILQLVYVEDRKVIVKKKIVIEEEDQDSYFKGGTPPEELPRKIIWYFKYRLMNLLHGINEEYEWKGLLGCCLAVFCLVTITLVIFPVIQENNKKLLIETAKRAAHFADEIGRLNSRALEQRVLDKVDTKFMDDERDVSFYRLFDLEGRIVRPFDKLNSYIEDTFSIRSRDWAVETLSNPDLILKTYLGNDEIGVAKKIMAFNSKTGRNEAVGVIAIRFRPATLKVEGSDTRMAFAQSLITSTLIGLLFFGVAYFLTLRPIEELNYQIEESLRGKRKNIESKYKMLEMTSLKNTINALLQRVRDASSEEQDEFEEVEADDAYVMQLAEFMRGSGIATMVLDSEKNLSYINSIAEDLVGIRESTAQGENLLDCSREKGFAATVRELCDNSANNNGTHQFDHYELGGVPHSINVVSLMGKDSFAKAFYVTFLKDE